MKKINANDLEKINGGNCLWWLVPGAASWISAIFFAPAALGFIASAAGYSACQARNGGSNGDYDYVDSGSSI